MYDNMHMYVQLPTYFRHMSVCKRILNASIIFCPPYFLRQGLSINPELTNFTRLVRQQAPGFCLCAPLRLFM